MNNLDDFEPVYSSDELEPVFAPQEQGQKMAADDTSRMQAAAVQAGRSVEEMKSGLIQHRNEVMRNKAANPNIYLAAAFASLNGNDDFANKLDSWRNKVNRAADLSDQEVIEAEREATELMKPLQDNFPATTTASDILTKAVPAFAVRSPTYKTSAAVAATEAYAGFAKDQAQRLKNTVMGGLLGGTFHKLGDHALGFIHRGLKKHTGYSVGELFDKAGDLTQKGREVIEKHLGKGDLQKGADEIMRFADAEKATLEAAQAASESTGEALETSLKRAELESLGLDPENVRRSTLTGSAQDQAVEQMLIKQKNPEMIAQIQREQDQLLQSGQDFAEGVSQGEFTPDIGRPSSLTEARQDFGEGFQKVLKSIKDKDWQTVRDFYKVARNAEGNDIPVGKTSVLDEFVKGYNIAGQSEGFMIDVRNALTRAGVIPASQEYKDHFLKRMLGDGIPAEEAQRLLEKNDAEIFKDFTLESAERLIKELNAIDPGDKTSSSVIKGIKEAIENELDAEAVKRGLSPAAREAYRDARRRAHQFYKDWESKDIIKDITESKYGEFKVPASKVYEKMMGSGANRLSPEDAKKLMTKLENGGKDGKLMAAKLRSMLAVEFISRGISANPVARLEGDQPLAKYMFNGNQLKKTLDQNKKVIDIIFGKDADFLRKFGRVVENTMLQNGVYTPSGDQAKEIGEKIMQEMGHTHKLLDALANSSKLSRFMLGDPVSSQALEATAKGSQKALKDKEAKALVKYSLGPTLKSKDAEELAGYSPKAQLLIYIIDHLKTTGAIGAQAQIVEYTN